MSTGPIVRFLAILILYTTATIHQTLVGSNMSTVEIFKWLLNTYRTCLQEDCRRGVDDFFLLLDCLEIHWWLDVGRYRAPSKESPVNSDEFLKFWNKYVPDYGQPSLWNILQVLLQSLEEQVEQNLGDPHAAYYFAIARSARAWAEEVKGLGGSVTYPGPYDEVHSDGSDDHAGENPNEGMATSGTDEA
jgi:hypothetical protein